MKTKNKRLVWFCIVCFPLMSTAFSATVCEKIASPELRLESGSPPTFALSGGAYFLAFEIREIPESNRGELYKHNFFDDPLIWKVRAIDLADKKFASVQRIAFGEITNTLRQEFPQGASPAALKDGQLYYADATPISGYDAGLFFIMRDGKPVKVKPKEYFAAGSVK